MNRKHTVLAIVFTLSAAGLLPAQTPRSEFTEKGAEVDFFLTRVQAKISYSLAKASEHFSLMIEAAKTDGGKAVGRKVGELGGKASEAVRGAASGASSRMAREFRDAAEKSAEEIRKAAAGSADVLGKKTGEAGDAAPNHVPGAGK